jgi:hypothetical protein
MFTNFEEKGKIFTQIVTKEPVDVIIQTDTSRIHGRVHVRPEDRLKDELDRCESFLAVTQAKIFDFEGENLLYQTDFIAVRITSISWVLPQKDLKSEENSQP